MTYFPGETQHIQSLTPERGESVRLKQQLHQCPINEPTSFQLGLLIGVEGKITCKKRSRNVLKAALLQDGPLWVKTFKCLQLWSLLCNFQKAWELNIFLSEVFQVRGCTPSKCLLLLISQLIDINNTLSYCSLGCKTFIYFLGHLSLPFVHEVNPSTWGECGNLAENAI